MNTLARELYSYIDLTTLNATDHIHSINELIDFALTQNAKGLTVAAICVYPNFGAHVLNRLSETSIHTAVVAGAFPHGQTFLELKAQEVQLAAQIGVHDIDVVLNRGLFFAGDFEGVENEIKVLKEHAGKATLKVILESGELKTEHNIRKAAQLAIKGGADFIKTSTGKMEIGANPEAVSIMCQEIKRNYQETGKKIGLKPSGGIRTVEDAALYRDIVLTELGNEWLTPELFRIGASSLANDLIKQIEG